MLRRCLAAVLVAPVLPVVAVVAAATTPATAASPAPVLRWELSQFFDDHLSVHALSDGATEDAGGVVTFPDGVGTYDRATGAGSIAYQGSVAGSFSFSGSTQYTITVSDPVVTIDADRRGTVTVVVESVIPPGSTVAEASTPPRRVVATTFSARRWVSGEGDLGTQTATPDFAGVLPAGSAKAEELAIPDGQPVDGKAWNPDFLGNLVPDVRAIFYASGASSDARKQPATIVAQGTGTGVATEPEPDAYAGLQWEVSAAYDATMETHTLAAGATEDDLGVVSFPYVSGTYDSETGEASVTYAGSVTALDTEPLLPPTGLPFPLPGSDLTVDVARVTVADPVVTTDRDGRGTVTAVVSSSNPTGAGGLAASTTPTRVELVRFDAGVDPWTDGTLRGRLVRTPAVFSAALTAHLVPPARTSFGTVATAAADTLPSVLTAAAPMAPVLTPATTVTTTAADPQQGLVLRVDGTGFRGVTRTGDSGVRVGLAPAGVRPDVTTEAGLAQFAALTTVPAADVVDRAFRTTLTAPAARLDPGLTYVVHTWQAPSRSNPTQDTAIPVDVDFVALGLAEALRPAVVVTPVAETATERTWSVAGTGFSAVTRPGDAGVYVGIAEAGGLPDVSVFDLSKFVTAAWVMPSGIVDHRFTTRLTAARADLDPAKQYAVYTWQAHTRSTTSQDTVTPLVLARGVPALRSTGRRSTTYGAGGTLVLTLPRDATGTVTLRAFGLRRTARVVGGSARFAVPRAQHAARYLPSFAYSGDTTYAARRLVGRLTVRRATPQLQVTRTSARRLVVRVLGPRSVAAPTGHVTLDGRPVRLAQGRATFRVDADDARFEVRYGGATSFVPAAGRFTAPGR